MFRWNSGCSAEQKTLGIPFRTVPQRSRMLGILNHGTKIQADSRNSVLNHSVEQKTLGIQFQSMPRTKLAVSSVCWSRTFCKIIFFKPFSSIPSLGIDSSVNLGMSTFFRGITQAIPSLFRGIFSERNSVANPSLNSKHCRQLLCVDA